MSTEFGQSGAYYTSGLSASMRHKAKLTLSYKQKFQIGAATETKQVLKTQPQCGFVQISTTD
jgi:hypothetical protein